MPSEDLQAGHTLPAAPGGIARRHLRVTAWVLGSLLLGGIAVPGSMFVFRQGLLPLIDMVFRPGPDGLSALRRVGIPLAAIAGYWAYTHWYEKREASELRLRPILLML